MCYQDDRNVNAIKNGLCSFALTVLMFFAAMLYVVVVGY